MQVGFNLMSVTAAHLNHNFNVPTDLENLACRDVNTVKITIQSNEADKL